MGRPFNSVEKLLQTRVNKTETCWNWTGCVANNGYSKLRIQNKHTSAHRIFYKWFKGEIEDGLQIDHLCRNKLCVNPGHLEAVTPKINILRSEGVGAKNSRRNSCIRNHPLSGENLYMTPDGRRECKVCLNLRSETYRASRTKIQSTVS